jgi:predicted nuclease of predicted toxin-antitoxin system
MRFLADENFPGDAVTSLRSSGHDVLWIRTDVPGITDQDVLARSLKDARVLLTFDKDFGGSHGALGCRRAAVSYYSVCRHSVRQVSARSLPMFRRHATIGRGIFLSSSRDAFASSLRKRLRKALNRTTEFHTSFAESSFKAAQLCCNNRLRLARNGIRNCRFGFIMAPEKKKEASIAGARGSTAGDVYHKL